MPPLLWLKPRPRLLPRQTGQQQPLLALRQAPPLQPRLLLPALSAQHPFPANLPFTSLPVQPHGGSGRGVLPLPQQQQLLLLLVPRKWKGWRG